MSASRIMTRSGRIFDCLEPRAEDVTIGDIAHALSMLCRFCGHVDSFYSVAQHSVLVSRHCAPPDALAGLLHDAAEAYVTDVPGPLKRTEQLWGYRTIEYLVQRVIAERFGLPASAPASVRAADEAVLVAEARDLMPPGALSRLGFLHDTSRIDDVIVPLPPQEARAEFLRRYRELAVRL